MGEDPLAETRLAISAQKVELERTADQLRDALNLKKRFQENPALVVGLGAGAIFLVAGGPVRVAKLLRRRLFRSQPEKAYDSLPKPMQSWVDTMAGTIGPRAAEARQSLSEELIRWRHDPKRSKKVSKKMAEEMARNLGQLKTGVLRLAIAAALGLVFLIALLAFVMAVLVAIGLWWVALILLVVLLIGAGLLAWTGIKRVTSTKFTPEETIAAVKEDVEWAKTRLLRRG